MGNDEIRIHISTSEQAASQGEMEQDLLVDLG